MLPEGLPPRFEVPEPTVTKEAPSNTQRQEVVGEADQREARIIALREGVSCDVDDADPGFGEKRQDESRGGAGGPDDQRAREGQPKAAAQATRRQLGKSRDEPAEAPGPCAEVDLDGARTAARGPVEGMQVQEKHRRGQERKQGQAAVRLDPRILGPTRAEGPTREAAHRDGQHDTPQAHL